MHRFFPLILLLLFITNCTSNEPAVYMPVLEDPIGSISYLALGDSYTIGESVAPDERFPVQLVARLKEKGVPISAPQIIAKTGWRTDNLKQAIKTASLPDTFDLVSLLIGVNNQYQGKDIEEYRGAFTDLLQKAIQLSGNRKNRVIILSIPDYAYTPFGQGRPDADGITQEINAYNAINKSVAEEYGILYFDITPISRQGLANEALVAADGLHPSGKMYSLWVDLMFKKVIEIL